MLKVLLLTLFVSFAVQAQDASNVPVKDLDVAIGIDEILKFEYKFNTKIDVGNSSLIKLILRPSAQEIVFKGLKAGKTSVTIRNQMGEIKDRYIVTITSDGKSNTVRELRELIGDIEGIEIGIKGGKVFVGGELVVPADDGRIATVLGDSTFSGVMRLYELSPHTQRMIARKMQEEINKNNMRDVTVRVVNKRFWLEGVVNSQGKHDLALRVANQLLPPTLASLAASNSARLQNVQGGEGPIVDFISINEKKDPPPPKKLIKISSQFVELSKDYKKVFAFKWSPLMNNDGAISFGKTTSNGVTTEESGSLSGTISNLFPKLRSAKDAGYVRVIQSGMVITKESQNASINKTKSIPYDIGGGEFTKGGSAQLTFNLQINKPTVVGEDKVDFESLNLTVSLPAGSSGNGQPQTTTNTVQTSVVVKSKESAVLGGVVQNTQTTDYDRDDPDGAQNQAEGASQGPLFNLIRSKKYVTSKSQYVVFVTPEIIESASTGTEDIRRKFRKRTR
jgi:pilus assembly protein CpaC